MIFQYNNPIKHIHRIYMIVTNGKHEFHHGSSNNEVEKEETNKTGGSNHHILIFGETKKNLAQKLRSLLLFIIYSEQALVVVQEMCRGLHSIEFANDPILFAKAYEDNIYLLKQNV